MIGDQRVCDGAGITRDPQLRARVPGIVIFVGLEHPTPAAGTEHSGQTNSNVDLNILT